MVLQLAPRQHNCKAACGPLLCHTQHSPASSSCCQGVVPAPAASYLECAPGIIQAALCPPQPPQQLVEPVVLRLSSWCEDAAEGRAQLVTQREQVPVDVRAACRTEALTAQAGSTTTAQPCFACKSFLQQRTPPQALHKVSTACLFQELLEPPDVATRGLGGGLDV